MGPSLGKRTKAKTILKLGEKEPRGFFQRGPNGILPGKKSLLGEMPNLGNFP